MPGVGNVGAVVGARRAAKKKAARQASRRARPIVQGEVVLQVGDEGEPYVEAPPNEAPQRRRAAEAPPPGCCLVM